MKNSTFFKDITSSFLFRVHLKDECFIIRNLKLTGYSGRNVGEFINLTRQARKKPQINEK